MIHDAYVEVTCDGNGCRESLQIALDFTYPDYSGKGGRYDHDDAKVNRKVEREGWSHVVHDDGEEHYCEACSERMKGDQP